MKITERFELTHRCDVIEKGKEFTSLELYEFATDLITDLYSKHECEILKIENKIGYYKNIYILKDSNVCFIVRPKLPNWESTESESVSFLVEFANKYELTPRVIEAMLWDYNSLGMKAIKGSIYAVQFSIFPIIPHENIEFSNESKESLVLSFFNAWNELNIDHVANKLHPYFQYSSDWVFDIIPSRIEFLNYLNGKFSTLIKNGIKPNVEIRNIDNKSIIVFNQINELAYLNIFCEKGLITQANLMKVYKNE
jgi:hypothetical protein